MARLERLELNRAGIRQTLLSPGVHDFIAARTARVAFNAGPGMEPATISGRNRARGSVITTDPAAMRAEAYHRKLTKALLSERG